MNETKVVFDDVEKKIASIPNQFWLVFCTTVICGLIAHAFMYVNPIYNHDGASIYYSNIHFSDLALYASTTRWGTFFVLLLQGNINSPWLQGVCSMVVYSIAAYYIIRYLGIQHRVSIVLASALLITSPNVTAVNLYTAGAIMHASALLLAVLALWCIDGNDKKKPALGFIILVFAESLYTSYVAAFFSLFLIKQICSISFGKDEKASIRKHFAIVGYGFFSVLANYIISKLILFCFPVVEIQERVTATQQRGVFDWLLALVKAWTYMPRFLLTRMCSFLSGNLLAYVTFWVGMVVTFLLLVSCIRKVENRSGWSIALVVVDILVLPLAMNVTDLLYQSGNLLMQWGVIIPWIFIVLFCDCLMFSNLNVRWHRWYAICTIIISCIALFNQVYLANASYVKAYNVYESGMQMITRLSERIESDPKYKVGKTPILFIGSLRSNYAPVREEYDYVRSMTGAGTPWWDTAITSSTALRVYLVEQAGLNIKDYEHVRATNLDQAEDYLDKYEEYDEDRFKKLFDSMKAFPSEDCVAWYGDVMIVYLGVETY